MSSVPVRAARSGEVLASMVQAPVLPDPHGGVSGEFRFHDLEGSDEFAIGAVKVRAGAIPHIGHTLGFRIEADGRSLVYISDHQAPADLRTVEPEVLELCHDADLLLHDAQYTEEEFVTLSDWGHSTANYAVEVAEQSGVKRLTLFHHDPAHTDETIDRMLLGTPGSWPRGHRRSRSPRPPRVRRGPGPGLHGGIRRRPLQGRHGPVRHRRDRGVRASRTDDRWASPARASSPSPSTPPSWPWPRPVPRPAGPGSPGPARSASTSSPTTKGAVPELRRLRRRQVRRRRLAPGPGNRGPRHRRQSGLGRLPGGAGPRRRRP